MLTNVFRGGVTFHASFVKNNFPMDKRIFHLKKLLSQHLSRNWTVKEMAAVIAISVPNLHRLFRSEIDGTTPQAYLRDLRLDAAAKLLADPECFLRISEIGLAVGLKNESHFTGDFKARYGMTPTQYQKTQAEMYQSHQPDETDRQEL